MLGVNFGKKSKSAAVNKVNTPVSDPRPSCWVNYHQVVPTLLNHTHSNRKKHGWNQESILCHDVMPSVHQYLIEYFFLDQLLFSLAKLVSLTIGLKIITGLGDYRLFLYPHYGKLGRTSSSCSSERKKDFWVRNILPKGLIGLLTKWPKKLPTCSNFCPFQKILLWANFDLLKYISIYIFVNENQKNYHGTFFSLDASSCTMWATTSIIQMGDIFATTELQPSMNLAAILQNLHCH